ncbi:probable serine/threonine-protein kinase pkgA [Drosophila innubila]|uniref:probable serine/threonine-protein kinase pkgA n=1 Tax=Drosophila innubila TaxID=198719 RepID=UPI00148DB5F1|nr:probable serine/threonine-protein kinase pkgA [Drosophila innubila]
MCNPQQLNQQQQEQQQQQQDQSRTTANPSPPTSPTSAYVLYLHREELRRHKTQSTRASVTKIQLTSELIARTKQNINRCSNEDLEILARETLFRKNLQRHLHHRRMQLQAWMLAKKQGKITKLAVAKTN